MIPNTALQYPREFAFMDFYGPFHKGGGNVTEQNPIGKQGENLANLIDVILLCLRLYLAFHRVEPFAQQLPHGQRFGYRFSPFRFGHPLDVVLLQQHPPCLALSLFRVFGKGDGNGIGLPILIGEPFTVDIPCTFRIFVSVIHIYNTSFPFHAAPVSRQTWDKGISPRMDGGYFLGTVDRSNG